MTRPARIVFVVNSDTGQINVHLAVIHSLLDRHGDDIELHLLTHEPGRKRCPANVQFHQIPGMSQATAAGRYLCFQKTAETGDKFSIGESASFLSMLGLIAIFPRAVCPYTPSEYISATRAIELQLDCIKPDLVVLDSVILPQAVDAARKLKLPYVSSARTLGVATRPRNEVLECSLGPCWPYPLPLHLIPLNFILLAYLGLTISFSSHSRAIKAARKQAGYEGPWLSAAGETRLCMGVPELDFDGIRPPTLLPVGPMLLPTPPLAEVDPPLDAWLTASHGQKSFTITFSLGSHVRMDAPQAESLLKVFAALLEKRPEVRVYAKIMRAGEYDLPLLQEMEEQFGKDRLRIVQWMDSDPVVILRTGKVDLAIHHGGSNSYHEALSLGIPQIALASWLDCYDIAARIEALGVGKWGNRTAAPYLTTVELLGAITPILDYHSTYKATAVRCAEIAARSGEKITAHDGSKLEVPPRGDGGVGLEGRDVGAEWIFRRAQSSL